MAEYSSDLTSARERLDTAVAGLDLTVREANAVDWLKTWDADSIELVSAVFEKARQQV